MPDSLSSNKLVILKASSNAAFSIDSFCFPFSHKQHRWDWGSCLKPSKKGQVLFPDLTTFTPCSTWDTAAYVYSACLPFSSLKAGYAREGMKRTVSCSAFTCNNSSCCSLCLLPFLNSLQPSPAPFSHRVLEQHLHPPLPRNSSRAWGEMVTLCSRYGTAAGKLT